MYVERLGPVFSQEEVAGIVDVYREAFGNEPWNEGYRCPNHLDCGSVFPLTYPGRICVQCSTVGDPVYLVEYWPFEKVREDFYKEMSQPDSVCLVVRDAQGLIGFAWGYRMSMSMETSSYLDAPALHEHLSGDFFYLDEVAIRSTHRGQGLGKKLVHEIFEFQDRSMCLRTLSDSRMYKLILHMGGQTILPISRGRVVMTIDQK